MNVISDSNYKPTKAESDGAGYTKTLNSLSSLYLLFTLKNQTLLNIIVTTNDFYIDVHNLKV
jgi:hypothetical protein